MLEQRAAKVAPEKSVAWWLTGLDLVTDFGAQPYCVGVPHLPSILLELHSQESILLELYSQE
jgi:hypothetical protein